MFLVSFDADYEVHLWLTIIFIPFNKWQRRENLLYNIFQMFCNIRKVKKTKTIIFNEIVY